MTTPHTTPGAAPSSKARSKMVSTALTPAVVTWLPASDSDICTVDTGAIGDVDSNIAVLTIGCEERKQRTPLPFERLPSCCCEPDGRVDEERRAVTPAAVADLPGARNEPVDQEGPWVGIRR